MSFHAQIEFKTFFVRLQQKLSELPNGVLYSSMRCLILILCIDLYEYFKPAALVV